MLSAVIEFEGFQLSPRRYIVKELAVCAVHDNTFCGRWTFQPPHPFDQLNRKKQLSYAWLSRNMHHMDWTFGELPYSSLYSILVPVFEMFPHIYVKGLEKAKFLEFLSGRPIYNLDDFKCPRVHQLPLIDVNCPYLHDKHFPHCAVYKAAVYARFVETL